MTKPLADRWGYAWMSDQERAAMAETLAEIACSKGEHRTETDPDTGDEVCRWCGEVIE